MMDRCARGESGVRQTRQIEAVVGTKEVQDKWKGAEGFEKENLKKKG